jgi:hypothetical protein
MGQLPTMNCPLVKRCVLPEPAVGAVTFSKTRRVHHHHRLRSGICSQLSASDSAAGTGDAVAITVQAPGSSNTGVYAGAPLTRPITW